MEKLNCLLLLFMMLVGTWSYAQSPVNNECTGAIDLSSSLEQGKGMTINGPYDNTIATTEASDPTKGYECFAEPDATGATPSLENTLWFKITGDGGLYHIEATTTNCSVGKGIGNNDTQMAIYSGSCDTLIPVACSEDSPNASDRNKSYPAGLDLQTEVGVEYFILVDGFKFKDVPSIGEFCMQINEKKDVLETNEDVLNMTIFENRVQHIIQLNVNVKAQVTDAKLTISNSIGEVVQERLVNLVRGANILNVNVTDLPSDKYTVSIESDTYESVSKFVK